MRGTPAKADSGVLVLVGTPIGNLGDLSARTIDALTNADVIAAEDTRRARSLLSHLGIEKKQILAIDANREESLKSKIVDLVTEGKSVVYTSDAGMPGVSDPGALLVRAVSAAGLRIDGVPGPSASVMGASLSGLCESGFSFAGFLSVKSGARRREIEKLADSDRASIVFESPKRIALLLVDALSVFGPTHEVFVGRELTKMYQELFYGTLHEAKDHFCSPQKGEFVVVFAAKASAEKSDALELVTTLLSGLVDPETKTKTLADNISKLSGIGRSQLYDLLLEYAKARSPHS